MLALCLMLLVTYHALNYAGIIGLGLVTFLKISWELAKDLKSGLRDYKLVVDPRRP